jgi:sec-independent protein translocase protein TatB
MFDIGLSELMVIGSVALIVLGPEKLVVVARTAGNLAGKAQRYLNDIKSDLARDGQLSELKAIKEQLELAGYSLQDSFQKEVGALKNGLTQDYSALSSPQTLPDETKSDEIKSDRFNVYQAALNTDSNQPNHSILVNWQFELENLKIDLANTEYRIVQLKKDISSIVLPANTPAGSTTTIAHD